MARSKQRAWGYHELEGRALLSGITYSLTTDRAIYQMGQPVQITYTETNTSDQAVTIDPENYLMAVWQNGAELYVDSPQWSPNGPASPMTLAPGQAYTITHTWDTPWPFGPVTPGKLTGAFVVTIAPEATEASPDGPAAEFNIAAPPSGSIASSLTTDQSVYQDGQTVTMTFTETNVGSQPVTVPTGPNGFVFVHEPIKYGSYLSVSSGNLWTCLLDPGWTTLQPGQSWTQTAEYPVGSSLPGGSSTATITNVYDWNGDTASFELQGDPPGPGDPPGQGPSGGAPSSVGQFAPLTTNHPDYQPGESVRITLTIPGGGPADIASPRVKGVERIKVLDGSQPVARLTRRLPASTLRRIEQGRTVKITAIWDGRPNQPGVAKLRPGEYTIDVTYGDDLGSTSIQVGRGLS